MSSEWIVYIGIAFVVIGVLVTLAGLLSPGDADVEGGGVIFIGPFPIVFGAATRYRALFIAIGGLIFLGYIVSWLWR